MSDPSHDNKTSGGTLKSPLFWIVFILVMGAVRKFGHATALHLERDWPEVLAAG